MSLFEIKDLQIEFPSRIGKVCAVRDVSFEIGEKECVALVGESGCGKSVSARSIIGLTNVVGGKVVGGEILYDGRNILKFREREWRKFRGEKVAMIFQDAMTALNPTMRIGSQIAECFRFHERISRREAERRAVELLKLVGIPNPETAAKRYPHEFSGGMRQRVVIAEAIARNPKLLIADEPTTALDVTIQAQILSLLTKLKEEEGVSILLITHDLGVVAGMAQKIVVMYAGMVVEMGTTDEIFYQGAHPYTNGLKSASPNLNEEKGVRLTTIEGMPPELVEPKEECPFADRCPYCTEKCREGIPQMHRLSETHFVRCDRFLKEEVTNGSLI